MNETKKFVGFDRLKQTITIEQVLQRYGLLEKLKRDRNGWTGACPLHGGKNPTAFRVNRIQNCWICFGDCHGGGSIVDFVSQMERINIREAGLLLQGWFNVLAPEPKSALPRRPFIPQPPDKNAELGFHLECLDQRHPYLRQRRLAPDTIENFGLGMCSHGMLNGWIAIPIHNASGRIVAYAGRWPGKPATGEPKYRLPRGFRKSLELFNQHRAGKEDPSEPLVVVEGFFSCMRVWQAGHPRVIALMGSMLSRAQETRLVELAGADGHVVLLFDADAAGRKGAVAARERLSHRVSVSVARLESGEQPDNLSDTDILALIARNSREEVPA